MAVLGASARLGRQDPLDFDLGAAPGQTNLVGECGQRRDVGVGQGGETGELPAGQQPLLVEQRDLCGVDAGPRLRGVDGGALGLAPAGW